MIDEEGEFLHDILNLLTIAHGNIGRLRECVMASRVDAEEIISKSDMQPGELQTRLEKASNSLNKTILRAKERRKIISAK